MNDSIRKAERQVDKSLDKFEAAMDHLAQKVEGTTESLQHVVEVASLPKRKLEDLAEFAKPYAEGAANQTRRVVRHVRENPQPVLAGMFILVTGFFLTRLFVRRVS